MKKDSITINKEDLEYLKRACNYMKLENSLGNKNKVEFVLDTLIEGINLNLERADQYEKSI